MSVYFLEAAGLVKIGKADDLEKRLRQMQPHCPLPLKVLAVGAGGLRHEQRIHRVFKKHRVHGEWFRLTPRLKALIDHVTKTGRIPEAFDPWRWRPKEYRFKRQDCEHRIFTWDETDEPRDGWVTVACRGCGGRVQAYRQEVLLDALRRKHGRIGPLPDWPPKPEWMTGESEEVAA